MGPNSGILLGLYISHRLESLHGANATTRKQNFEETRWGKQNKQRWKSTFCVSGVFLGETTTTDRLYSNHANQCATWRRFLKAALPFANVDVTFSSTLSPQVWSSSLGTWNYSPPVIDHNKGDRRHRLLLVLKKYPALWRCKAHTVFG